MIDVISLALSKNYTDKEITKAATSLTFKQKIVESLPSSGEIHTIYFIKNNSSWKDNYYDEYLWIPDTNSFEKIGSTEIPEFPTSLPNPNAITFTGAVEETYDGSEPKTINIPDGGSGTDSNAVHYTEDTDKTDKEKARARANIGAQELINDLGNIRKGAAMGANSVQKDEVNGLVVTKAASAIDDINNDNKLITPAAVKLLIDTFSPEPVVFEQNTNLDMTERAFSKDVQYQVGDKCLKNVSLFTHLYECTTAHIGEWNSNNFNDLGLAFTPPEDLNIVDYLPAINSGNFKVISSNKIYIQTIGASETSSTRAVQVQYISSNGCISFGILSNKTTGAITGILYSPFGVSST